MEWKVSERNWFALGGGIESESITVAATPECGRGFVLFSLEGFFASTTSP